RGFFVFSLSKYGHRLICGGIVLAKGVVISRSTYIYQPSYRVILMTFNKYLADIHHHLIAA
ncbi:MAG: hypothetical protein RR051_07930, partial [Clostridiales bacterium]